jgi:hypothetical protein
MIIERHCDIEGDFRKLKRYPAPEDSLEKWERLFCTKGVHETPAVEEYPGYSGARIFKARVVPLQENVGKSKGYRVIFQMCSDDLCKIVIFTRHTVCRSEAELIEIIKRRLRD